MFFISEGLYEYLHVLRPPAGNTRGIRLPAPKGGCSFASAALDKCNARHANYLLDVGPDRHGLLPEPAVKRLAEIGARRAKTSFLK